MEIKIITTTMKAFKNDTVFFPATHKSNYTVITNSLIQNPELTFLEVGIMTYLLSLPKDWKINKQQIQKRSGFGDTQFNKAWKNLVNRGYIIVTPIQSGYSYEIIEKPINCQNPRLSILTIVKNDPLLNKQEIINKKRPEDLGLKARASEGIKEPPKQIEETGTVSIPLEMDDTSGGYTVPSFDISDISIEKAKGLSPDITILDNTDIGTDFLNLDEPALDFSMYEIPKAKAVETFHIKEKVLKPKHSLY